MDKRVDTALEKPAGTDHEDPWMLVGTDGRIAFTEEGKRELTPYFARAGIDLSAIKTRRQYIDARRAASPYFLEHLRARLDGKPNTLEYNGLRAIVYGDDEAFERIFHRLTVRNLLHTV